VLTAANLRGTGFVAREEELTGTIDGEEVTVLARYAGLEGYLTAKAHAVRHRGFDRDCYDLVFVVIYNRAGGPSQAGEVLRRGQFAADVRNARAVWREIAARFVDASAFGRRATPIRLSSSSRRPTAPGYARTPSGRSPNSSRACSSNRRSPYELGPGGI